MHMGLGIAALYFFSAVPVIRLERQVIKSPAMLDVVEQYYEPVWICKRNSTFVHAIIRWEHRMMDKVLGREYATYAEFRGKKVGLIPIEY